MKNRSRSPKRPVWTAVTLAVSLCLLAGLLSAPAAAASPFDDYMNQLASWDVMRGSGDGNDYRPDDPITRAEFVALVNRGYGYTEQGPTPFEDVEPWQWYADDIAIAYTAGYFSGTSPTTASPEEELSREQALTLLARSLRLEPAAGSVLDFTDGNEFSSFSKGYVAAAVDMGIISGFPDGSFRPTELITRGQMSKILALSLGNLVHEPGSYAMGDVYGNLTISTPGATLKDTTITGNLYVSGGLDLGAVSLENVRVLGDIIVAGGGQSETGQDSVILQNVLANNLLVDNLNNIPLSLRSEGDTKINQANIRSSAFIQDRSPVGYGLLNIHLDDPDGSASYTLSGNLKNVVNKAPFSSLNVSKGTLQSLTVDEKAVDSMLNVDSNTTVKELNLDVAANVTGAGDVGTLNVSADGATSTILPDEIDIRPGILSSIFGDTMDTKLGEEASAEPRLLAGYPVVRNVAPTSATAVFSGNKTGTVYWAVSSVTDGSLGEDQLITPSSYGSKAVRSGNLRLTASNQEITAAVTGLTRGGSYYLSAILVDARGTRSPLKVVSFSTPDDSVPNFSAGYPVMSLISGSYAQVSVMPTKSCDLYYALYEQGSTAPTPADFRSSALTGSLENGHFAVTKSLTDFVDLGERDKDTGLGYLEELASYDVYLWLNDADNGKSSAVRKLTFTTVDKTPPRFTAEPRISSTKTTSVGASASLNENGTIFWVAVKAGEDYPKPATAGGAIPDLNTEAAKFQVAKGLYGIRNGRVNARAGTEAAINITGLQGETSYDLYYVAQDTAGNYSDAVKKITITTLDNNAPTVTQAFTEYEGDDATTPYAYSDVQIIFSENVQWSKGGDSKSLTDLYKAVESARGGDPEALYAAQETLAEALRNMIQLTDLTKSNKGSPAVEKIFDVNHACTNEADWVIDYREATAELDGAGQLVVTFPYNKGIRLGSGSTYQFTVKDAADATGNAMGSTQLDRFTTISAQVALNDLNQFNRQIKVDGTDITIHGAISLEPISTSTVAAGRGWDLLVWTDKDIEMTMYYRTHTETASGAEATATEWQKLGSQTFTASTAASGFTGASVTYNYGYAQAADSDITDRNTFEDLKELDEDLFYDFAFRVTRLDGSEDDTAWSKTVNFRFNVVTGDGARMSQMAQNVSKGNYNSMVPAYLSDITVPKDFEIAAPFMDTEAPYFTDGAPIFTPYDSYVELSHQLNREGTVYYVVAPIASTNEKITSPLIPTTWTSDDNDYFAKQLNRTDTKKIQLTVGNYRAGSLEDTISKNYVEGAHVPTAGKPISEIKTEDHVLFPLEQPAYLDIINPKFRSDYVKKGSFPANSNPDTERIDGLERQTDYIIYFVIQGGEQIYSRPQAFYFRTTDVQKPVIRLNQPSYSHVGITNQSAAESTVQHILVRNDSLNPVKAFTNEIGPWDDITNTSKEHKKMTVLEALTTPHYIGVNGNIYDGSLFDNYVASVGQTAAQQHIQDLTTLIQGGAGTGSQSGVITGGSTNLRGDGGYNEVSYDNNKDVFEGQDYIFVCMGTSQGSGACFVGVEPVFLMDNEVPEVTGIDITISGCSEKGVYGKIDLILNDLLYNLQRKTRADENDTEATRRLLQIVDHTENGGSNSVGLGELQMSSGKDVIKPHYSSASAAGTATRLLQFTFGAPPVAATDTATAKPAEYIQNSATLTIQGYLDSTKYDTGNLANPNGTPNTEPLMIKLDIKKVVNRDQSITWTATASVNRDWGGVSSSSTSSTEAPEIEVKSVKIEYNRTHAQNILVDTYLQLNVTVTPGNATDATVQWSSSNPEVVSVDSNGNINCIKVGEATITAKAGDKSDTLPIKVVDNGESNANTDPDTLPPSNPSSLPTLDPAGS